MVFRSMIAGLWVVAMMLSGGASAQIVRCPDPPTFDEGDVDLNAEARRLLKRLSVAFDLYDHDKIDRAAILKAHQETPAALVAKLSNVANRCAFAAGDGPDAFQEQLPELRRLFLEATGLGVAADVKPHAVDPTSIALAVQPSSDPLTAAERLEQFINLSPRELWQKLWFRSATDGGDGDQRWAVIVASPADADTGWDMLAEHQERWSDVYFQLHEPYYEQNKHYALIVGRRLRRAEAGRLLGYAKELGMAEDAYIWPVPGDDAPGVDAPGVDAPGVDVPSVDAKVDATVVSEDKGDRPALEGRRKKLDLTVLEK